MNLPRARRPADPFLFSGADDLRIPGMAVKRNYTGDFFEEATAALTGWRRLVTDARCPVCPDLHEGGGSLRFAEVKACGGASGAIIYRHRLEKDIEWTDREGAALYFFLWEYAGGVAHYDYLSDVRRHCAGTIRRVVVARLGEIMAAIGDRPCRTLIRKASPAWGAYKYGYSEGWCVPVEKVVEIVGGDLFARRRAEPGLNVYGLTLPGVEIVGDWRPAMNGRCFVTV